MASTVPHETRRTQFQTDIGRSRRPHDERVANAYCPHCYLLVAAHAGGRWPARPERCPHCRLMIGPGRARPDPDGTPGARGAAAGVMAERARRAEASANRSGDEVCAGIRTVAQRAGVASDRLAMVEYQQHALLDDALPKLHDVLAAFGSWKQARREAARPALHA